MSIDQPTSTGSIPPLCPPPAAVQTRPSTFEMLVGAVDSHAHVIGAPPEYPLSPERKYTPPPASPEAYLSMLDNTGLQYGVLVQVSAHGRDNRLMLETVKPRQERLRAIVVPEFGLGDAAYQAMSEAGTVGMRMNVKSAGEGIDFSELKKADALAQDWGWHLQIYTDITALGDYVPTLSRLKSTLVFDHMAHVPMDSDIRSGGFQNLLSLVKDGSWVKLSGANRISDLDHPYPDTVRFAQALVEAAPDRCVWGSDWPHVALWNMMPTVAQLLDTLALWVPDKKQRDAILTENAHRLYRFDSNLT
jgi:2-pyrone-4,6-dicarboxylate lactonase